MRLDPNDVVVAAEVVDPGSELLIVSEKGYAKRTPLSEFPTHGRGGGGVKVMTITSKTGPIATARVARPIDEVMVISAEGQVLRTRAEGISEQGRAAQGVILLNLDGTDKVAAVAILDGAIDRGNGNDDDGGNGNGNGSGNGHGGDVLKGTKKLKAPETNANGS